jgi:hypothetical protein
MTFTRVTADNRGWVLPVHSPDANLFSVHDDINHAVTAQSSPGSLFEITESKI